jgi:FtsH-binding integral membrane protein
LNSIISTFLVAAITFAALSLYGFITKKDLTSFSSFLFVGLIGIIVAMVVNIFLMSSALNFVISVIGVLVFAGLTAYDTQKLKEMHLVQLQGNAIASKASIIGALTLYLDFINLFLMLLRLFGGGRD